MTGALDEAVIATVASAATTSIGAAASNTVTISGTTTITSFGTGTSGTRRQLRFSGALTLTYNASSLILPTSANIITEVGDCAEFVSLGSSNWACISYTRASGRAVTTIKDTGTSFIEGLTPIWNSANSISVSSGAAYVISVGDNLQVPTTLTLSGLTLSGATWYHLYLYSNSGVGAIELVTTAPSATYQGTARSKSADTTRRYLGSFKTGAANTLLEFYVGSDGFISYLTDTSATPTRVISAGSSTVWAAVSCSAAVPVTSRSVKLSSFTTASGSSTVGSKSGVQFQVVTLGVWTLSVMSLDASQNFYYINLSAGNFFSDVLGFTLER